MPPDHDDSNRSSSKEGFINGVNPTQIIFISSGIGVFVLILWLLWPLAHLLLYNKTIQLTESASQSKNSSRVESDSLYKTSDSPYKTDPATYGAFGDSYGSLTSLFACLAFIATAAALLIQIYLSNDQKKHQIEIEKKNRTFAFYDDFNSSEMFKVRIEAEIYLQNDPDDIYKISKKHIDPKNRGADSIWPVMRFYQKLKKSIDYNQVDEKMVIDLFGEVFIWWYFAFFEKKIVDIENVENDEKWDVATDLKNLQEWFEKYAVKNYQEQDKKKYQEKYINWNKIAKKKRKEIQDTQIKLSQKPKIPQEIEPFVPSWIRCLIEN